MTIRSKNRLQKEALENGFYVYFPAGIAVTLYFWNEGYFLVSTLVGAFIMFGLATKILSHFRK